MKQQTVMTNFSGAAASPRVGYPGEREVERRQASSTIVHEEYLSALPNQGEVRYVEVPVVEEVVRRVAKKEVVEVEKVVPRYETEWVETIVEVPQVHYVDKEVEVPQIREVIRHVTKKEYVDVPREVIKKVAVPQIVQVEKVVEIPGQVVEVPKPYVVENKVQVPVYKNTEVPMIVAQTIKPIITETNQTVDVDVFEYEPQVVVVDVTVPKPVSSHLIAAGVVSEIHKLAIVPAAQYNAMLKMLNTHIQEIEHREILPFVIEASGHIPMLGGAEASMMYPAAIAVERVEGYVRGAHATRYVQMQPGMTISTGRSTGMIVGGGTMTTGPIMTGGYTTHTTGPVITGGYTSTTTTGPITTGGQVYSSYATRAPSLPVRTMAQPHTTTTTNSYLSRPAATTRII